MKKTYELAPDGKSITCLRCKLTSHNAHDVAQLYCGRCHAFHGETMRGCLEPDCSMILVLVLGETLPLYCWDHSR